MNKNIGILIIIVVVVLAIGIIAGIYIGKKLENKKIENTAENFENKEKKNTTQGEEKDVTIDKNEFSIKMPKGWHETNPLPGITFMANNLSGDITDDAAKKINFKTYYSIVYDNLNGLSKEQYIDKIKNQITQTTPDAKFINGEQSTINGNDSYTIEVQVTNQGVSFQALVVTVKGTNDDVWLISLNTTQKDWSKNINTFKDIVNSFYIK